VVGDQTVLRTREGNGRIKIIGLAIFGCRLILGVEWMEGPGILGSFKFREDLSLAFIWFCNPLDLLFRPKDRSNLQY
jgi:hypothetical protein